MVDSPRPSIRIDLNEFKLHLHSKGRSPLTLHFNSPSRSFYLSIIAMVVNEMKKSGKIKSIPLQEHLGLLALLNETIGGAAGSSDKENLLHRIYVKWKDALPNLEEGPLFKVLGKKKEEGEGGIGKVYSFTDEEKDRWANLFEYKGSHENVRLKFAIEKIGLNLDEISIIFAGFRNEQAWDQFFSSLKNERQEEQTKFTPADGPSIAVLPFVNLSEDPKQEYFVDGMTDDLITDLSKISGLLVISRNSTFTYKGKPVKAKQVAEDLGVRYILEGSVRRAGEQIRINAQLIDALTGHHVWAERYDGAAGKVFELQDKVTGKIISALAVKLTGNEKELIAKKGTDNVEAYDAFLRGWVHYLRFTPDDFAKALQSIKKATQLDQNFGRAYAALALTYWMGTYIPGFSEGLGVSWLEARLRTGQYLRQAMKNPTSTAHNVNALLYLFRRQYEESVSEFERALALDPNDPSCYSGMGLALYFSGKPKEAADFLNRAMRLDPHNPARYLIGLGAVQFCIGNMEEAANLFEQALRLNPELSSRVPYLAATYGLLGREEEACAALDIYKKGWDYSLPRIMYYLPFKDRPVADRFVEGLIKAGIPGQPLGYFLAYKENRLTAEEIKKLLFGTKITGATQGAQHWWLDRKIDGACIWRGPGLIPLDTGKSRIEGDMVCTQYQKLYWGIEYCATVFRNPRGTYKNKDEYFLCTDIGFAPFSLVR